MKHKAKEHTEEMRRLSLRERISRVVGIPSDAIGSDGFYAEWRGRGSVTVRGCRRILSYGAHEISLRTRDGDVFVCGEGLTCFSYFSGAVGIEGCIASVTLTESAKEMGGRSCGHV